ncbi:MAG: serine aminopeptidase domain-containing protein [Planctomycetota bacterium]|jgi:pimeloyl-ACP methyl ester carboxylesterase
MRYVYCHPLFDERKCAHRFSFQLNKAFEKNNLQLKRFDYRGTGESGGRFCDVTMDSLRNDLDAVINSDRFCLIGTRFGAAVAFDFCHRSDSAVHALILIEPVVNGQNYAEYLFRKQHLKDMMTGNGSESAHEDGFFNLEGYKTSNKFIEQIRQFHLNKVTDRIKVEAVFIIQISASSRINAEYDLLAGHLKESGISACVEVFNLPVFWERIPDDDYTAISEKIVEWCR